MAKEKPQTKVCKHCRTEIPYDAKVCPQCRKGQSVKWKWILIAVLVLGIIGAAFGDDDSEKSENEDKDNTAISADSVEIEGESDSRNPDNASDEKESVEYKSVFVLDLLEKWDKNKRSGVMVSFKTDSVYKGSDYYSVSSKYYGETSSRIEAEIKGEPEISEGDWVTVSGIVADEQYKRLENAKIESTGKISKKTYEDGKAKYDKRKKKESEKREKKFREAAEEVSYDELMRYPDTYKEKKIKVIVNITEVEPDGIIFPGDIQGTLDGKEVAVYDEREVKEPKLAKGDTVTIYGNGNGLTAVKVKQKSGIFSKTIDKYSIPGISIKYMDLQ